MGHKIIKQPGVIRAGACCHQQSFLSSIGMHNAARQSNINTETNKREVKNLYGLADHFSCLLWKGYYRKTVSFLYVH
jgi:hypothetical protein